MTSAELGGVPAADIIIDGIEPRHGGVYVLGDAFQSADLATQIGRRAQARVISVFANLSGLPPLIMQAGTHEVLLDDAVGLARKAAADDVAVTLDLTPKVPTSSRTSTRSSTKRPTH